ncbi:MAG TPA: hypothetical protein VM260_25425 [Pirellula sp.]|nr:hypothetical protein [Pirellula sp.]
MRPRGSTLIEMAISLPIFSMLMVLAIGGVHQTMRISRLAKDRGQLAYALAKLEQSVRNDVHQADSAKVERDEKSDRLSLHLAFSDDSRIVYHSRSNRIDREQLDATGKTHFDSFAMLLENKILFEVEEKRIVTMSVHRLHRDQTEANRLELFVRSHLGRPHLVVPSQEEAKIE